MTIEHTADAYLAEWAKWAGNDSDILGFPKRCITEKMGEGGVGAGSPLPPVQMPDDVGRTDLAVARLRMRNRSILYRVIKIRYLERAPIEAIMRACAISRSQAYRTLQRAQRAIYLERRE